MELLIKAQDTTNLDSHYLDARCWKTGEVIVMRPDGWQWGRKEVEDPQFTLVRVLNASEEDLSCFLFPEMETNPREPNNLKQRRMFRVDTTKLKFVMTFEEFMDLRFQASMLVDPNVFG